MDFAANPRCPYMDLGQAFYNRILGVSVFIIHSSLRSYTYCYFFDERTAKKGSDEVISCVHYHIIHHIAPDMKSLMMHCDGCAGQSWNNRLALYCEEMVDPDSDIAKMANSRLRRIDLYRGVTGHTYMEPDTQGGRYQKEARKILLNRDKGFVHKMKTEDGDPDYTIGWVDIVNGLRDMEAITPGVADFHDWSTFLLGEENGGTSPLYTVPTPKHCFRGPNSAEDAWRISNCHYLNFGYGETSTGELKAHHGVWFARDNFNQRNPDEIYCRNKHLVAYHDWQSKRFQTEGRVPKQKQIELKSLSYLKQKDLHQLAVQMEKDEGDFSATVYPNPDTGKKWTDEEKEGIMSEVRSILRLDESKWTSPMYYILLKWIMKKGYSKYTTLAKRKAQWQSIVAGLPTEQREEIESMQVDDNLEAGDTLLSRSGFDPRRSDENEHVDDDEFFDATDAPWDQREFNQLKEDRDQYIQEMSDRHKDDDVCCDMNEEERWQFFYQLWTQESGALDGTPTTTNNNNNNTQQQQRPQQEDASSSSSEGDDAV